MNALLKRIGTLEAAPPWGIGTVIITFAAAFIAIIVGFTFGFALFPEEGGYREVAGWTLSMGLIVVMVWQTRRADRAWLKLAPPTTPLPLILFVAFGFAVAIDLIGLAVTGGSAVEIAASELANLVAPNVVGWLFAALFMLVAQPIGEELVFRGVAFPAIRALVGAWGGLIINALIYALFHLLAYPLSAQAAPAFSAWYGFFQPFLDGLVIAAVRAATGSTRAAIIAHAGFGVFALLKLFVLVSS